MVDVDRSSKLFIFGIILISVVSIALCGFKYFFQQDYIVQSMVACDPVKESCFVSVCDPLEEECSSDPNKDTSFYKIYEKLARDLPACDSLESCSEMQCDPTNGCIEYTCNEDLSLEIGDECSNPEDYQVDESIQEEKSNDSMDELSETGE